jgi:hypothetical protein
MSKIAQRNLYKKKSSNRKMHSLNKNAILWQKKGEAYKMKRFFVF